MLILTFQADCGAAHISGIKEALAMLLERWGDVRLVNVREVQEPVPDQTRLAGF